jgi:hypothetical protein
MKFFVLIFLCTIFSVYSYYSYSKGKHYKSIIKFIRCKKTNLNLSPFDQINYLTSIKEYTIITIGNSSKKLEGYMYENGLNVYYVNLDNMIDKDDILKYLIKEYKNYDAGGYLWIFYRGFFIGSRNDIDDIINKRKNRF